MRVLMQVLAGAGALISVVMAGAPAAPAVTPTPAPKMDPGKIGGIKAVVPTEPGQIGINPPTDTKKIKGSIGVNTKYLTELGGTTKWIGVNTEYITLVTKTSKDKAGATQTAKASMGIGVSKNKAGGIDVLLSPKVKAKLEGIAKQVKPCAAKRRRRGVQRRGTEACGLRDFVNRVGQDPELREEFTHQITDEVWASVDEGYEGSVDGNPGFSHSDDEGYFSDEDGFFDGASDASSEAVVFSTEEEAAAIAAEAAGVAEGSAVFAGATVTSASFLALLWGTLGGKEKTLDAVYQVPKESIHKITKTKTKTKAASKTHVSSSTSTTNSCPTGTALPKCGTDCEPKRTTEKAKTKAKTDISVWTCTKGKSKGCECLPGWEEVTHPYDPAMQSVFAAIFKAAGKLPTPGQGSKGGSDPKCDLNKLSTMPYNLFGAVAQTTSNVYSDFCKAVKKDDLDWTVDSGGKNVDGGQKRSFERRTPPLDPGMYKDVRINLEYKKPGSGSCTPDCNKAFESLGQKCHAEGGMNKPMTTNGSIDSGCGVFSFKIYDGPGKAQCKKEGNDKFDSGKLKKGGMVMQDSVQGFCKDFNPRTPLFLGMDESGKKADDGAMSLRFSPKSRGQVPNSCDCESIFRDATGCIGQGDKNIGEVDNDCGTFTATYGKGLSDKGSDTGHQDKNRQCYGMKNNKYVWRDILAFLIKERFCPDAVAQGRLDKDSGSIGRIYFDGTLGAVELSISWAPGLDFKPSQDSCVDYLLGKCADDCDIPGKGEWNWKGGGEYIMNTGKGNVRYEVKPLKARKDAPPKTECVYDDGHGKVPCVVIGEDNNRSRVRFQSNDFNQAKYDKISCDGGPNNWQTFKPPVPQEVRIHPGNICKTVGLGFAFDNTWIDYGSAKRVNVPTKEANCVHFGVRQLRRRCIVPIIA